MVNLLVMTEILKKTLEIAKTTKYDSMIADTAHLFQHKIYKCKVKITLKPTNQHFQFTHEPGFGKMGFIHVHEVSSQISLCSLNWLIGDHTFLLDLNLL